ncbi:MAG: archaeosortase/exosortase family protein, partial [Limisphaerales bacterium]
MRRQFQFSTFNFVFCLLPFAWLWFVLVNQLRVEWTLNPQYSYGWAVPFLCAFLIWQRLQQPDDRRQTTAGGNQKLSAGIRSSIFYLPSSVFCLLAFLYFPTRLIEEANPGWRLISWALALEVIGLTLCALRLMLDGKAEITKSEIGGRFLSHSSLQFSDFIFPICFFLVAVPWPTFIEQPLIQGFTRMDASATCELLGWIGVPAMPHGNIIEVATGEVGIAEA